MLKKLFGIGKETQDLSATHILIYDEGQLPDLEGFEEIKGYAVDAYPYQHSSNTFGPGDFSKDARELAVRLAASHYEMTIQEALQQLEICIVPAVGFHGRIMAKRS